LVHLGQFALRGAGLIIVEATAVTPQGRISPQDSGLWKDEQIAPLKRIVDFVHSQGVKIGIRLAHAGRKSSTIAPFINVKVYENGKKFPQVLPEEFGGWPNDVVGPSLIPWDEEHANPKELTVEEIHEIQESFVAAANRAEKAGFDIMELHFAHGFLAHDFFLPSPINVPINMVDHLKIGLDSDWKLPRKFAKSGQKINLYLLEFLLQIGLMMIRLIVGKLNNLLNYPNY